MKLLKIINIGLLLAMIQCEVCKVEDVKQRYAKNYRW